MRRIWSLAVVAVLVMVLGSVGQVRAQSTANVVVTAEVVDSCSITGGDVLFGALPVPAVALYPAPAVNDPTVTCTVTTAWTISDDLGANESGVVRRMENDGTPGAFLPYNLTYTANGIGNGLAQPLLIGATVAGADYGVALTGTYTDTVVLTVAF